MIRLLRKLRHLPINYRKIAHDFLVGTALFVSLIVLVQLGYPSDRILPSVKVQGASLGSLTLSAAQAVLDQKYRQATIVVQAGDKHIDLSFAKAGIDIDRAATVQSAARYPMYQRLIPFSSLAIMLGRDTPVAARYDDERLSYFAQQISKESFVQAIDAGVVVRAGKVELVPSTDSQNYPPKDVEGAIRAAALLPKTTVRVAAIKQPAKRTDSQVQSVLLQAQQSIDAPLVLKLDSESIPVDKTTIGGWLDFTEDEQGDLHLTLKKDAAQTYLEQIQSKMYIAPGTTKVTLIDGIEVNRTTGVSGRGIAMDQALEKLAAVIGQPEGRTVDLPIASIAPKVVYERTLSNSNTGLATLLKDIVKAKGDYGIAVMQLNGLSGKVNGGKQYTAASTFKLFVAYGVFQRINSGAMHWSDPIVNGYNAEGCFEVMIVNSDNACAIAFGEKIGWQNIDDMMTNIGLTSTQVQAGNHLTTASDLALFLYKLQNGTLLNSSDRTRLISAMERQIYRQGIPAGTGVTVADKVGFLYGYLHDAAIVYGPKGPYVLVIMSNGSSWSQLADAAKQIHNFLSK